MAQDWQADEADVDAVLAARQSDPFAVLGPHKTAGRLGDPRLRALRRQVSAR